MNWPSRRQSVIGLAFAIAAGGAALYLTRPPALPVSVAPPGSDDPLNAGEIKTILEPDAIQAIDHPTFVASDRANAPDSTRVIGVAMNGEAHAFPIAYMSQVEIVNDRLGGGNIAITW